MEQNLKKLKLPKGITLYAWQEDFINNHNKDRVLLCAEAGTGKSFAAISWLQLRSHLKALVIAPLGIQLKWKEDLKKWKVNADVVTTDAIKKIDLNKYGAVVVDECQNINSALFDKSRSQRTTAFYTYVRSNPKAHIFLASATPIRSKPENLHTLACYIGIYWDIKRFRDEFLHLTNKFGIFHYEPNKTWRKDIRPKLENISHIVNMADCVDVPVHEHKEINIPWTKDQEEKLVQQYLEPSAEWHARHKAEQGEKKYKELAKIMDGNRKVIVVCYYLEQIEYYKKCIGDDREVYIMTGSTKNQGQVVKDANESEDCILLIQAGLGAGFDLDRFSVMVFASMSFAFVHLVQMQARINRIHNLHPNQYIYLLGGKCDLAVYQQVHKGFDFHPPAYYNKNINEITTTRSTSRSTKKGAISDSKGTSMVSPDVPF